MRAETDAAARRQYLSFVFAGGDFAIPLVDVKEILQFDGLTHVPGAPGSIRGVLNLRGNVVPVVDLARKFGLGEMVPTPWTCVLVLDASVCGTKSLMGVLADSVTEVIELGPGDVEPPPSLGGATHLEWLAGVGKLDQRFTLLLDVERTLSVEEREAAASLRDAPLQVEQPGGETPAAPPSGGAP